MKHRHFYLIVSISVFFVFLNYFFAGTNLDSGPDVDNGSFNRSEWKAVMTDGPANGADWFDTSTAAIGGGIAGTSSSAPGEGIIVESRIASGSDDAEERPSRWMYITSSDLELVVDSGSDTGSQTVGLRFNGMTIPQGATVLAASIQFKVDESTSEATSLVIRGEDSDNAAIFVSSTGNITNRPLTASSVAWSPAPWTAVGEAGPDQQTPDISWVIQEIVDRPGWSQGNSLAIIITGSGRRTAESYEGDRNGAALLRIEYLTGTGNSAPLVSIGSPPDGSHYIFGETVHFAGSASDAEDGDLTTNLTWTSNLEGVIGMGGSFSTGGLSEGAHAITASVTDSGGRSGQSRIDITVGGTSPAIVRGPYLQCGTPDSVVVRWRTDSAMNGRVRFGEDPEALDGIVDDFTVATEHEVQLNGLSAGTQYFYSIGTTTEVLASGSDYYFMTSPIPGTEKSTRIWVLGDIQQATSGQSRVRDAYYDFTDSVHTDLWFTTGDHANNGLDSEYQNTIFEVYPTMLRKSVFWPSLGNHDALNASSGTQTGDYFDIFTLPKNGEAGGFQSGTEAYYSFDFANIHFICLDSADSSREVGGPMLTWLQADLAQNSLPWVIAFWHHSPYSKGSHDSDTSGYMTAMRENALPLLEGFGVDLVLTGHCHSYERSFFLDGHYGFSDTLTSAMILDEGSGRADEEGAYQKPSYDMAPHEGAVYALVSTSSSYRQAPINHPAMYYSELSFGSGVLDISGNRLDFTYLDDLGNVRDHFTIIKGGSGQPPSAPSNLSAVPDDPSSINLTWQDNSSDEAGFYVERKVEGENFIQIADLNSNVTTYNDTGLISATTYTYRVQAYRDGFTSDFSNEASATTEAANQIPIVTITAPADGASYNEGENINFIGLASDPEDGDLTAGLTWNSSINGAIGTGASFSRSDLSVGTHTITASVTDGGGLADEAQITLTINDILDIPDAPSNLTATVIGRRFVKLGWTDNSSNEDGFEVYRSGGESGGSFILITTTGPDAKSFIDKTGTGKTIYFYKVRAVNTAGASADSNTAEATTK